MHTIEFIRPGRATHAWVVGTVQELKSDDALSPVALVVPNYYAGRQIRWALAQNGGYLNVRSILLGDLAQQVLGLEGTPPNPLTPVLEQSAVRVATRRAGGCWRPLPIITRCTRRCCSSSASFAAP